MAEGACYDRGLAALAIKQARGDLIEAAFLLRAYRTTLPRFAASEPLDTGAMRIRRRISATYKDLPGGQVLGPTFDYTHRLLDFALAAAGEPPLPAPQAPAEAATMPRVTGILAQEGLMQAEARLRRRAARPDARAAGLPRRPAAAAAGAGARRRGLPAGARLFDPARLRQRPSLRRRDPHGRGGGRDHPARARLRHRDRRPHRDRMPDGQPVRRIEDRAAAIHPRLRPGLRPCRAEGDGHGAGRPVAARRRGTGRGRGRRRRRTRNSCCTTATMSRRPASSST